jgi:HEAT repeat protein
MTQVQGLVRSLQSRDPLRVGQVELVAQTGVLAITDLAPRVGRYLRLIADITEGVEPVEGGTPAAGAAAGAVRVVPTRSAVRVAPGASRKGPEPVTARGAAEAKRPDAGAEATTGGSGSPEETIAGLPRAHAGGDPTLVASVEQALIAWGEAALPEIAAALEQEQQFHVRLSLRYCQRAIEGEAGAQALVRRAQNASDPRERLESLMMLEKLRDEMELSALAGLLVKETEPRLQTYMVRALGAAPGEVGIAELAEVAGGSGERLDLRIEAVHALARRVDDRAVTALLGVARGEEPGPFRSSCVRALAARAGREAAQWFRQQLVSEESNDRAEAASYFARVGSPDDVKALTEAAEAERDDWVRSRMQSAVEEVERRARGR